MKKQELKDLQNMLQEVADKHKAEFKDQSGRSQDYEDGFVKGIEFVCKELLPAFQEAEK